MIQRCRVNILRKILVSKLIRGTKIESFDISTPILIKTLPRQTSRWRSGVNVIQYQDLPLAFNPWEYSDKDQNQWEIDLIAEFVHVFHFYYLSIYFVKF